MLTIGITYTKDSMLMFKLRMVMRTRLMLDNICPLYNIYAITINGEHIDVKSPDIRPHDTRVTIYSCVKL